MENLKSLVIVDFLSVGNWKAFGFLSVFCRLLLALFIGCFTKKRISNRLEIEVFKLVEIDQFANKGVIFNVKGFY